MKESGLGTTRTWRAHARNMRARESRRGFTRL